MTYDSSELSEARPQCESNQTKVNSSILHQELYVCFATVGTMLLFCSRELMPRNKASTPSTPRAT